ncbi:LysR family transcriptional regulator [Erwinia persicina]|uniref:LysR family transcriptional regulator n=1 Tax=Erwinia persicina TaxID=55211 RepID=UPI00177EC39E|nr:LysR family transcriptional regulator [Erwinia persicina]MBD8162769.1 LysR family transcriptional regulator [Erwinia persicina]MBD8214588.1 LysR family transcriptional regulator [Erwinia persicina]
MNIDSDITFRKLEIFIAFMNLGNLARTADALRISSVSVHRALHSLEESVRCPLFIHKGRNLVPLPAAHTLWEYSQEALDMMSRGVEETRKTAGVGQGRIRIGTLYSLTLETIPQLIMGMKLRRPDLEMELTMGSNQMLTARLEEGSLDAILIAVAPDDLDHARFESLPLFDDDIFLAAPAASGLDTRFPADLRDFRQEKFVSLAEGFATWQGFQEAFNIAGYEPNIVTRVNDIFSMLSLVQAGVGYTLLPGRMKRVYENSVQLLRLAQPYQMRQNIAIVFERNREHDPNLLALVAEGRMYSRQRLLTTTPP